MKQTVSGQVPGIKKEAQAQALKPKTQADIFADVGAFFRQGGKGLGFEPK
jgi:hypothetical protein